MRRSLIAAAVIVICLSVGNALPARGPACAAPSCAEPTCAAVGLAGVGGYGDDCDPCATGRCRGSRYEGLDAGFNCGCNGSYKYPVPPLYTYHWPGLYSAQLMTDYHSPWRFPPLKPYVEEVPAVEDSRGLRPVAANMPLATRSVGEIESMSSKLLRPRR